MTLTLWIALGLFASGAFVGIASGALGIGGGVMVIPILMFLFGFSQAKANGTSLAMLLPPIGIFAVLSYYRAGNIDVRAAALLALGFFCTVPIGSMLVNRGLVPAHVLRYGFSLLLIYVAGRLIFQTHPADRAVVGTMFMIAVFPIALLTLRLAGKRIEQSRTWGPIYHARLSASAESDFEI